MARQSPSITRLSSLALVIAGAVAPIAAQQPEGVSRFTRTTVRVKPEMVTEWVDLEKNEVIPALKKAGVPMRAVLQARTGNVNDYVIITRFPKWADWDEPGALARALGEAGAARLMAKLRKCVEWASVAIMNVQSDHTIPWGDARISRTVERRIIPGKMDSYLAYHKATVLPAMQKMKEAGRIAGASLAIYGPGGPSGGFLATTFYNSFADLDAGNPFIPVIGQDAWQKMADMDRQHFTSQRVDIRVYRPDLSF
jgi:hypothetical protein